MDQKKIQILVILLFYQKIASGTKSVTQVVQENAAVDIECIPPEKGTVMWFRVLDNAAMEFIGSFMNGQKKQGSLIESSFSFSKMRENILKLKSFNKVRDSGMYICGSFINNKLSFGKVTRLEQEVFKTTTKETFKIPTKATITKMNLPSSTTPCACHTKTKEEMNPSMMCNPIILGALSGSCGLLVWLLLIIICYCNRIRTRRCPHHYKRRPRVAAPGKQAMVTRHV